jgi:hypothetical protein
LGSAALAIILGFSVKLVTSGISAFFVLIACSITASISCYKKYGDS